MSQQRSAALVWCILRGASAPALIHIAFASSLRLSLCLSAFVLVKNQSENHIVFLKTAIPKDIAAAA